MKKKQPEPMKVEEDPAKVAARKAFLLSSVPDALKKSQGHDKNAASEEHVWLTPFAPASAWPSHVTQIGHSLPLAQASFQLELRPALNFDELVLPSRPASELCGLVFSGGDRLVHAPQNPQKHQKEVEGRLSAPQIYAHFRQVRQTGHPRLERVFCRYLERKIEADTLEEEARTKNMSLNEVEEERNRAGLRRGRLRLRHASSAAGGKKSSSSRKTTQLKSTANAASPKIATSATTTPSSR